MNGYAVANDAFIPVEPPGHHHEGGQVEDVVRVAGNDHEPAAPPSISGPSSVLYLLEDSLQVREQIRTICGEVNGFLQLPMLIAPASREQAMELSQIEGVLVADVGPVLTRLVPLLRGLDVMAAVETRSAAGGDAPYVVGGTRRGLGGYPILIDRDGRRLIDADETLTFDTRPASLSVINLSLQPPLTAASEWPWSDLDPINVATRWLASRQLCVFASGNQSERRPGREHTSAWAEAPWVLSVGATGDQDGTQLADYSNTGTADQAGSGPDVVAWGASALDNAKTGTSYAAPRVSGVAAVLASVIEQIRHQMQVASGEPAEGIPLVGLGWIDKDYRGIEETAARTAIPALPAMAIDSEGLHRALAACTTSGIALEITSTPQRLRRMVIAAARPLPNYKPYEVGAGFISTDVVLAWLATWTANEIASHFAASDAPATPRGVLPDAPIFSGIDPLRELADVALGAAPIWRWDFATAEFGMRRDVS
jgi:hypothetical protein